MISNVGKNRGDGNALGIPCENQSFIKGRLQCQSANSAIQPLSGLAAVAPTRSTNTTAWMKNIVCFAIQLPMVLAATVRTKNINMAVAQINVFFVVQQPLVHATVAPTENIKNSDVQLIGIDKEQCVDYDIHGPFDVTRSGRLVDKSAKAKREFWDSVEETTEGLSAAVGCYVFCIGKKPWYVGLAEKQSFKSECFQPHKINAFNSALDQMHGRPYLIFLSKLTSTKRFAKPTVNGHRATRFLEDLLIGMALASNSRLENIRGTKFTKELVVPGIINTPKGKGKKKSVQVLKDVLRT